MMLEVLCWWRLSILLSIVAFVTIEVASI